MVKAQVPKQRRLFVVLDAGMHEALRVAAASENRTMSQQIRSLLQTYLETCGAAAPSLLAGRPAPPFDDEQA